MGCGCGGSKRVGAKPPKETLKGPKAEGFYWNGPETTSKTKADAS